MTSIADIERMTMYEYEIRKTAYLIESLNRRREIHEQAWANHNVKATKKLSDKKSVPYYKNFRDFFDYEKEYNSLMGIDKKTPSNDKKFGNLLKRANL